MSSSDVLSSAPVPPSSSLTEACVKQSDKQVAQFRNYDAGGFAAGAADPDAGGSASGNADHQPAVAAKVWQDGVKQHYRLMRTHQTVDFVKRMQRKWLGFDHAQMTVAEAFEKLKGYVDSSDPDTLLPNLEHMMQAAEAMRSAGRPDWMQLIGLVHDMGKIMFLWGDAADGQSGTAEGPQFALGGDTWVVGCALPDDAMILPEYNKLNPDMQDARYNSECGVYEPGCGIMQLDFAFGHDEYMYQFMLHNKCPFPEEGLAMLRLHSCYPWHTGGAYQKLQREGDEKLLAAVRDFNQFDLYTKSNARPDVQALWPYYQALIDKYMPGKLDW